MGRAPQTKTVATRLRENSDESPGGCWLWNKSTVTGYGQIWVGSRVDGSRRRVLAHRASYETFVGPVPEGMEVDHLCFNRLCINPAHLEPVTPKENVRRHWARPSTATELPPLVAQVRAGLVEEIASTGIFGPRPLTAAAQEKVDRVVDTIIASPYFPMFLAVTNAA